MNGAQHVRASRITVRCEMKTFIYPTSCQTSIRERSTFRRGYPTVFPAAAGIIIKKPLGALVGVQQGVGNWAGRKSVSFQTVLRRCPYHSQCRRCPMRRWRCVVCAIIYSCYDQRTSWRQTTISVIILHLFVLPVATRVWVNLPP